MPLRLLRIGQARLDRTEQSDYLDLSRGPAVIVKGERSAGLPASPTLKDGAME
jgi:hypothetical protein